ncbi:MAG: DNA repair protein RecN [Erysipelotrichaceae bacterium]|nr:DNA repair protein RecN [Erysipelotrichaceae bacterium]
MIEQLMVKDYILFDQATIDFKNNMSVITGETGAGKSLLIDAIGYLSGGRMGSSVVRKGKEKAVLQMILSNPSQEVLDLLEENGFDAEDEIIITRIVNANGKGRITINSQAATNAFVKKIVDLMVDVHSQMDTIKLMDPQVQLELLDTYAKTDELKEQTAQAYSEFSKIRSRLRQLKNETFSDAELEFITAQLNEIQDADIQKGELEDLTEKIKKAQSAQKNLDDYSSVLYLFNKDQGVQEQLASALKILKKNSTAQKTADLLNDLYYSFLDVSETIRQEKEDLTSFEEDLDNMQEREFLIKKLYRKYGGSHESLMQTRQALEEKVDRILHRQDLFDRLEKDMKQAYMQYMNLAKELSEKRQSVFGPLKKQIEQHARDLMLEHCVFEIQNTRKDASKDGIDDIVFMVSMNPGSPLTTLKQSASGGELSRLMLALKVVFQASNGIGTLIFDEIDTGVSGKVALAMGSKMHALAENYQVLCITHLASVAVWADDHYHVQKQAEDDITSTTVRLLNDKEHVEELAVMTSGTASETAVASMKDLVAEVRNG